MSEYRDPEEILREANSVKDFFSCCGLEATISCQNKEGETIQYTLSQYFGAQMIGKLKNQIYSLLEENMEELFIASGWGWDEEAKRKELFNPMSKFLVVTDSDKRVVAFVIFRFEWDDEDEPEYPVLFLYEIQVREGYRSCNLGGQLLNYVKEISNRLGMTKIMLTCFKQNAKAMQFYLRNGFGIDSNSPSMCGFNESYELLSNLPAKIR